MSVEFEDARRLAEQHMRSIADVIAIIQQNTGNSQHTHGDEHVANNIAYDPLSGWAEDAESIMKALEDKQQ